MPDYESGQAGRGYVPRTQGVTCSRGVDHKGGACLCGPPRDPETGQKIDTRSGKRYGEKR